MSAVVGVVATAILFAAFAWVRLGASGGGCGGACGSCGESCVRRRDPVGED